MKFIFVIILYTLSSVIYPDDLLKIYIDADRTGVKSSGLAIEQGIRTALEEVNYSIKGYKIDLIIRDHRGNSRRSLSHLKEYIEDDGLVVFCGLHSPPVLSNLDYINKNRVLLLDPWAAAGPITRSTDTKGKNWVFRLSIDDTRAGEVITAYATDIENFKKPVLLLEDTGWGNSNKESMTKALSLREIIPLDIIRFKWGIKEIGAKEVLNDIYNLGADVIFFVGNTPEGKVFFKTMAEREEFNRIPIRSHWGITGGDIFEVLGKDILVDKIDLKFIQTSFSFLSEDQTKFAKNIFKSASRLFDDINKPVDIKAPNGFIHAYDLTKILLEGIRVTNFTGDIDSDREQLRSNLEKIKGPVEGLIKVYHYPFTPYSSSNYFAHEALNLKDYAMAKYRADGGIVILGNKP